MIEPTRILLIDDEQPVYQMVSDMLARYAGRFRVEWAATYDEALQMMSQAAHDIYLVDYDLGDAVGTDLISVARQGGNHAPMLILTGRGNAEVDQNAMMLGAVDYMDKADLRPTNLERAIRYAIQRRRNEDHLRRLLQRINELEQVKTTVLRMAALDLRTSLTTIQGFIQLIAEESLSDSQRDYLGEIDLAATAIDRLIENFRALMRIEMMDERSFITVDLREITYQAYATLLPVAEGRGVTLHLDVPEEALLVRGSMTQLNEAARHLAENGVLYTPAGGEVTLRLLRRGDQCVFEVEDNGLGIPPAERQNVFQPFYRLDPQTPGIGLGLYLVRTVMEQHSGQVYLKGRRPAGTVAGFSLPLAKRG